MENPVFKKFIQKSRLFSFGMTALMLCLYFSFILIIAFNKALFAYKILPSLTLGMVCGIGLILLAWVFTGVYVVWANQYYDKQVHELKKSYQEI